MVTDHVDIWVESRGPDRGEFEAGAPACSGPRQLLSGTARPLGAWEAGCLCPLILGHSVP